jgi:uncharacterized protein (TIGR03086 family)
MTTNPDPRKHLDAAFDQALALIDTVRPDDHRLPTACTDFDVAALVGHTIFAADRIAQLGNDEPLNMTPDEISSGVTPADWHDAMVAARDKAHAGWARPGSLEQEYEVPWGTFSGDLIVGTYMLELVTHTWDLADALGRTAQLDAALAEAAFPFAETMLPAEPRGGELPFAAVVTLADDAPVTDRLAGYMGRRSVRAL